MLRAKKSSLAPGQRGPIRVVPAQNHRLRCATR